MEFVIEKEGCETGFSNEKNKTTIDTSTNRSKNLEETYRYLEDVQSWQKNKRASHFDKTHYNEPVINLTVLSTYSPSEDESLLYPDWHSIINKILEFTYQQAESTKPNYTQPYLRETINKIFSSIETEPVEDGFNHPAEKNLREILEKDEPFLIRWLQELIYSEGKPSLTASVLKCIGRIELSQWNTFPFEIIESSLLLSDVEIRDVAVQTLEHIGTNRAIEILEAHSKREAAGWLKNYINRVISDLKNS